MKKITTILLVNVFVFLMLNNLRSQSQVIEKCGFDHLRSILLQDSNYLRKEIDAEQKIAQYISQSQSRSTSSIYTIPVIVHVLHLGELLGVGTNISDAQIQSAITNLNDVYRGQTAGSPVDFEIEFALAQQDPNCNSHSGVNRINASSVPNYLTGGVDYYGDGGEADQDVLKDLSRWPEKEYFNIWIVSEIENNNGGFGIQGYANFFTGSAYEGSIMMASVFGFDPTNAQPSFNLNAPRDNSTVVHEIGHYLHLHHTFKGDGDADDDGIGDACPGDVTIGVDSDGCPDTEPHKRYTSQCKAGLLNDCTGATFGDNTAKNFMSYASCQDRLTSDQKTRSRAMLATSGISLIYSKGDEVPINYSTVIANVNCSPQTSSTGLSGAYTGIKNFTIDDIFTNTSSWSDIDGGYVDNTLNCQKVINVFEDSTYNFEVSTLYNANNIKGYIDFNNDGDFLDANEQIFDINTADNTSGNYTSSSAVNITIPTANGTSVVSGTKLRLRLNSDIGIVANACEAPQYGQVEDYTVIINESNSVVNPCPILNGTDVITACDSYTWIDGITYNNSNNTSIDTLTNAQGCDSVVNLELNIQYSTSSYSTISSCNSYNWNGQTYTNNGIFISISTNPSGCLQTDSLDLTITSSSTTVNDTVCDSYLWNGNILNTSGTYFNSNGGCLEKLNLVVDYTSNSYLNIVACDEYILNGNTYTSSGIYFDTLQTLYGCDSTVTLDLTLNYNSNSLNTITSCNDYLWNGSLYNNSGFYFDTLQSINGCDSLVTLSLIIKDATVDTLTVNSCDFYTWRGEIYTQSGIYQDTLQSVLGCDSILQLDLTLGSSTFTNDSVTRCQDYLWNGNTYNLSGVYTNTLTSIQGCDSVVTLYLTIINSVQGDTLNVSACYEFLWQGNQYNQTGLFSDVLVSNSGCDSIIYLNITVNSSFEIDEHVNACLNYNWNGITYNISGVYVDTLQSSFGCDSIINLNLNISNNQIFSDSIISCGTYIWNGLYLDSSGQYIDTLQTIGGCDSVLNLDLSVYESAFFNDSVNTCEYYDWNAIRYTSSGVYIDTFQTSNGCDSIVSLILNLFPVYQDTIFASACDSFVWYGNTYTSSGIFNKTFQTISGCDSVEVLNFYMNIENNTSPIDFELVLDDYCLETHWNIINSDGIIVHQEGPYDCNINGSGFQSNQTINRTLSLTEQDCYTFTLYDDFGDGLGASQWGGIDGSWLLNDLNGNTLSEGQGDFGNSVSISFYINEDFSTSIFESENNLSEIIAYPNPFVGETEIRIINFKGLYNVTIRDIQGKIVHKFDNLSDNYFTIRSNSISKGIYWVVLDNHPTIKPLKLIVK